MKKALLLLLAFVMMGSDVFAAVDRYKTDVDTDNTINHITYELPLYYSKERMNLLGTYTLATNIGGKSSGTLSFDIKESEYSFSTEVRNAILRIAKDIRDCDDPHITISFTLSDGEKLYFDGSYFTDWHKREWNQILHVSYNSETGVYRSYIMFPLEYLKSTAVNLSGRTDARYKYVLKQLSKNNIVLIQVTNESSSSKVNIDIPISRPTAETMNDMINHKIKAKKTKKSKVENGRKADKRHYD